MALDVIIILVNGVGRASIGRKTIACPLPPALACDFQVVDPDQLPKKVRDIVSQIQKAPFGG